MIRVDKNKLEGRGANNQGNHAYERRLDQIDSYQNKIQTFSGASEATERRTEANPNHDSAILPEQEMKPVRARERRFNLLVDGVPYIVRTIPFKLNNEILEYVFTQDSSMGQLKAINDDSSTLPVNLEEAISEKLLSKS